LVTFIFLFVELDDGLDDLAGEITFQVGVEVVLRHFHRCRPWSSTAVVLLLEGHRLLRELVIREYGGHEGLCGSGHRSVTPYVQG
jgi:hypothetical protein